MELKVSRYRLFKYLFIIILAFLAYNFYPEEWCDLYRYYEDIETRKYLYSSISEMISNRVDLDFLYYTVFFVSYKVGISPAFITTIYVCAFYLLAFAITENYIRQKNNVNIFFNQKILILIFSGILSLEPILVSVGRNYAATVIFMIGILLFMKKKKILAFIVIFISVFFHAGMAIFIALFLIGYVFYILYLKDNHNDTKKKILIRRTILFLLFVTLLFTSKVIIRPISNIALNIGMFSFNVRYIDVYLQNTEFINVFNFNSFQKYPLLVSNIILAINLLVLKKYDVFSCIGLVLCLFSFFSLGAMPFMAQRVMLFFPIFIGPISFSVYQENKHKLHFVRVYMILLVLASLFFFIDLYVFRANFFAWWIV